VIAPDLDVVGPVLAARSNGKPEPGATAVPEPGAAGGDDANSDDARTDGGSPAAVAPPAATAPTTIGGEGRITLAVGRSEATALLGVDRGRVLVLSRGTRREYELTALLRRTGKRFRKVSVVVVSLQDGHTIGEAEVREAYDVAVLAARRESWTIAPSGTQSLSAGDDLFVVGSRDALDRFAEVAA
jgi:hypothetical protein